MNSPLKFANKTLDVVVADITSMPVDAIVNAANTSLRGGGGVDGAIHRAAGPELLEECKKIGGCPTGEARITSAYSLPAQFVIHTVGPVWNGGTSGEPDLLANAYQNSLQLAEDNKLTSISFPAISTGVYGYPQKEAAEIAVNVCCNFINNVNTNLNLIQFCCFSNQSAEYYYQAFESHQK